MLPERVGLDTTPAIGADSPSNKHVGPLGHTPLHELLSLCRPLRISSQPPSMSHRDQRTPCGRTSGRGQSVRISGGSDWVTSRILHADHALATPDPHRTVDLCHRANYWAGAALIMINFPPSFSDHSCRGRYGQYFHYLAKRLFALGRLKGDYRERAIGLACDVHRAFVIPSTSAIWKMKEDLSGP